MITSRIIATYICRKQRNTPQKPDVFEWECDSSDKIPVKIKGWAWRSEASQGTIFLLHGWTDNCGNTMLAELAFKLARRFGLAVVAFDARNHGWSGSALPTFGTAEKNDLQAVLSFFEAKGFAKPFIGLGDSYGAMAVQRAAIEDVRLEGAVLLEPPAWPYDALGVCLKNKLVVHGAAMLINREYGFDIVKDGDIRLHQHHPQHEPFILYVMGTKDHYGIDKSFRVYQHWYQNIPSVSGDEKFQSENCFKKFVPVSGAGHSGYSSYCIFQSEQTLREIESLCEKAIQRANDRHKCCGTA